MARATVSAKGQVVIPVAIRRRLGIGPGSKLEITEEAGALHVRVVRAVGATRVEDGYGMLHYSGAPRRLSDFEVAQAIQVPT